MASKSQYYYLKIKENFFDTEDMKLLESMDNGYLYSNILMKMYLLSLKNGGRLMYKDKIPYNSKMLSTILNHNVDVLDKAIQIFRELNLIEILDSGAIFMLDIQNYIGKSSDEADRIRAYRNKIETEKQGLLQMYNECTTDVDNIKDKDITKDKDIIRCSIYNIYDFIEKNFGRTLSPIEYEEISTWEDNDLTRYAIKQSVLNGKYNIRYISVILNNYKKNSITTVQQAQKEEEQFKQQQNNRSGYSKPIKQETVPEWFNKDIEAEYLTDEQVAIFEKKLRGKTLTNKEEEILNAKKHEHSEIF